jgi:hypothetical protein
LFDALFACPFCYSYHLLFFSHWSRRSLLSMIPSCRPLIFSMLQPMKRLSSLLHFCFHGWHSRTFRNTISMQSSYFLLQICSNKMHACALKNLILTSDYFSASRCPHDPSCERHASNKAFKMMKAVFFFNY